MNDIAFKVGDALQVDPNRSTIIAHVCNDTGAFGAGFAHAVAVRYPQAQLAYFNHYHMFPLGGVMWVRISPGLQVANMIAQSGLPGRQNPTPLSYAALDQCLSKVADRAKVFDSVVQMPRIGTGLARGKWALIERLIYDNLIFRDIKVEVYDLPTNSGES